MAELARQEKEKQKRRAAELLSASGDGGCCCWGCWCCWMGLEWTALPRLVLWQVSRRARLLILPLSAYHCTPLASSSPQTRRLPADAYAECYPSYYDHGTMMEDSDEEGAGPTEQVRRSCLISGGQRFGDGSLGCTVASQHLPAGQACPGIRALPCSAPLAPARNLAGCLLLLRKCKPPGAHLIQGGVLLPLSAAALLSLLLTHPDLLLPTSVPAAEGADAP